MSMQHFSFSRDKRVQSIASEGNLSIKALSLPAGESLKKHQTANTLYLQCLEGSAKITIFGSYPDEQNEIHTLTPNALLRIEANRPHAVDAEETDALLLLILVGFLAI